MYDVIYTNGEYWVSNNEESHGPYYYAAEAQEICDELNKKKTNNNQTNLKV